MNALNFFSEQAPLWHKRFDEIRDVIEQRQRDLARLHESQSASSSPNGGPAARSLRNKGSTESLKPPGEPPAYPVGSTPQPEDSDLAVIEEQAKAQLLKEAKEAGQAAAERATAAPQTPSSPGTQQQQMDQIRKRATLRKRNRTASVISTEDAAPKYKSRELVEVWYDEYVQKFLGECLAMISSGRNLKRKEVVAARAQLMMRKQLEPESDQEDTEDTDPAKSAAPQTEAQAGNNTAPTLEADTKPSTTQIEAATTSDSAPITPALGRITPRASRLGSAGFIQPRMYARASARGVRSGANELSPNEPEGVWTDITKHCDFIYNRCSDLAHELLRDGVHVYLDASNQIQQHLSQIKELVDKEIERIKREEPAKLEDENKARTYREPTMRKPNASGSSSALAAGRAEKKPEGTEQPPAAAPAAATSPTDAAGSPGMGVIEADDAADDMDEDFLPAKLNYRSTRRFR